MSTAFVNFLTKLLRHFLTVDVNGFDLVEGIDQAGSAKDQVRVFSDLDAADTLIDLQDPGRG